MLNLKKPVDTVKCIPQKIREIDFKGIAHKIKNINYRAIPQRIKNIDYKAIPEKIKNTPKKKLIIVIATIAAAIILIVSLLSKCAGGGGDMPYETATAEKRDIRRAVSASSVIEANDTYNVTALVTGEILTDTFSEGDTVKKDDVLYTIEASDAQNRLTQAENSLEKARQDFTDTVKKRTDTITANNLNKENTNDNIQKALNNVKTAQKNYNNLTITSDYTGTITEVLVNDGDSVGDGTKLAKIENTSRLKIQLPFNEADVGAIATGSTAELTLAKSGDKLWGTVTQISSAPVSTTAHAIVRYVTVTVDNPGALTDSETAAAVINGVACSDLGTFEYLDSGYITAKTSGKIGDLYLQKNDHIRTGQTVGYITSDNVVTSYENAQMELESAYRSLEKLVIDSDTYSLDSSVNSARMSLENAEISLEDAQKNLDDYTIKAPIDGTIITKNKKAGEKLEQGTMSSEPMAVIYDMSVLKVKLTIDETDIHNIKMGQQVTVTADAVTGRFTGEVTKVGIDGTSSNGVTTYPVEVSIVEYGNLLPGMNVDCEIEVESAKNVVALPVGAIQRGNVVYIKGRKTEDNDPAPDGYCSRKVETGVTDSVFIEIKNGVDEGDEIISSLKPSGVEAQGEDMMQQMQGMHGGMMGGGPPSGGMMGGGPPSGGGMPGGMR